MTHLYIFLKLELKKKSLIDFNVSFIFNKFVFYLLKY